jgi:hypothetical protein
MRCLDKLHEVNITSIDAYLSACNIAETTEQFPIKFSIWIGEILKQKLSDKTNFGP